VATTLGRYEQALARRAPRGAAHANV